jgi:hypothetical protein
VSGPCECHAARGPRGMAEVRNCLTRLVLRQLVPRAVRESHRACFRLEATRWESSLRGSQGFFVLVSEEGWKRTAAAEEEREKKESTSQPTDSTRRINEARQAGSSHRWKAARPRVG